MFSKAEYWNIELIHILKTVFSMVGIGLATLLIDVLCSTYYIVILAWGLYYLYVSLRGVLLWETCGNAWNTDRSVGLLVDLNVVINHFSLLVSCHIQNTVR